MLEQMPSIHQAAGLSLSKTKNSLIGYIEKKSWAGETTQDDDGEVFEGCPLGHSDQIF